MKKIVCKKPCRFGGKDFAISDDIPVKLVDPAREATLIKYGFIAAEDAPEAPSAPTPTNAPDGSAEGQRNPNDGQNPDDNSDDEKKEPDESAADNAETTEGGKKQPGKKVKE